MIYNTPNEPSKFRTKNWVEINNNSHEIYNTNSQIKFKTSMLKSSLCDYSDACILVSKSITFVGAGAGNAAIDVDRKNKQAIFKHCAPATACITEINNMEVDKAKDLDVVIPLYNLIEYNDN